MNSESVKELVLGILQSRMLQAIVIGVLLVLTDMRFGWISLFLGGFSSLLVVAVIVGIIARKVKDGILAMLGVSVLSVLLMTLLLPVLYPEWAEVIFWPGHFILLDFLFVSEKIIHQSATLGILGQPWYEVYLTPEGESTLGSLILTPFLYGFTLLLGGLGGLMGKQLWKRLKEDSSSIQPEVEPKTEEPGN